MGIVTCFLKIYILSLKCSVLVQFKLCQMYCVESKLFYFVCLQILSSQAIVVLCCPGLACVADPTLVWCGFLIQGLAQWLLVCCSELLTL